MMKNIIKDICILLVSAAIFFILASAVFEYSEEYSLYEHNKYDSYTFQAMAWRDGRTSLDKNYKWLELAVLNDEYYSTYSKDDYEAYEEYFFDDSGKLIEHEENEYYVSFPAFPSVPMYLLSFIFEDETPSNLVSLIYCILAFLFAIMTFRRLGYTRIQSLCAGAFLNLASSGFYLAAGKYTGGVWHQAQNLSLFLTMAAFYFIAGKKKIEHYAAFILLGLAVGCRPFQIVYYLYFAYVLLKKYDYKFVKTIRFYIPAAIIGGVYMFYNYIRFGNVLEFGHNYLPEFRLAPSGQFSISYISENLEEIVCKIPTWAADGLTFTKFGNAFWVCNTVFVFAAAVILIRIVVELKSSYIRNKKVKVEAKGEQIIDEAVNEEAIEEMETEILENSVASENESTSHVEVVIDKKETQTDIVELYILSVTIAVHFMLIILHKTLGAYQFGSRYTVDIIPAVLILVAILAKPIFSNAASGAARRFLTYIGLVCLAVGVSLNVSAAFKMFDEAVVYRRSTIIYWIYGIIVFFFVYIINELMILLRKRSSLKEKIENECSEKL